MSEDGSTALTKAPVYDQQFFIQLALNGKDVWNAWRRDPANEDICVTFEGVDFREEPQSQIDFTEFEFGEDAKFKNCKWSDASGHAESPGRARFSKTKFCYLTDFTGSHFGDYADFSDAQIIGPISFVASIFGHAFSFQNAFIEEAAEFSGSRFYGGGNFSGSFIERANFEYTKWNGIADFSKSRIGVAKFKGVTFLYSANFTFAHFEESANFNAVSKEEFRDEIIEIRKENKLNREISDAHDNRVLSTSLQYDSFRNISFYGSTFSGPVDLSGREFTEQTSFKNAKFCSPPIFDRAKNLHLLDFTNADVRLIHKPRRWFTRSGEVLRLRTFRKVAEETKNHDLERDLYIEERKAERGVYLNQYWNERNEALNSSDISKILESTGKLSAHSLWIAVMGLYALLADYGRSFMRPLIALGLSIPLFRWAYHWSFSDLRQLASDTAAYRHAIDMVGLGNAVPFVGPLTIDADIKKFLFCGKVGEALKNCAPVPPESYQWLVLTQNLVSITLVFFIGLALRNYFKIK